MVSTTLAKLADGYTKKDNTILTTVLEDDWAVLHKGVIKPMQALLPLAQSHTRDAYTRAKARNQTWLLAGAGVGALCLLALLSVAYLTGRAVLRPHPAH